MLGCVHRGLKRGQGGYAVATAVGEIFGSFRAGEMAVVHVRSGRRFPAGIQRAARGVSGGVGFL